MVLCPQHPPTRYHFLTARSRDPSSDLLVSHIDVLRQATRIALQRWPFVVEAAVILPNHLHMLWQLPAGDPSYAKRWRLIRSTFARHVQAQGTGDVWQRRVWEHAIRDHADFERHVHVIASAPVHAGLATSPSDWPYSSLRHRRPAFKEADVRTTDPAPSARDPAIVATSSQNVLNFAR